MKDQMERVTAELKNSQKEISRLNNLNEEKDKKYMRLQTEKMNLEDSLLRDKPKRSAGEAESPQLPASSYKEAITNKLSEKL